MKRYLIIVLISIVSVTMLLANEIVKTHSGNSNYEIKKGGNNVLIVSPSTQYNSRSTDDTLQYLPADGGWDGQFVQSPGDAMITAFKMPANATIKAVNVPVYEWGTGDQQVTISLHKLSYPFRTDGTTYPAAAVNGAGWAGGYDMDPTTGWMSIMGTTYTPGGTAGVCDDGDVVLSGAQDPLGTVDATAAPPGTPTMGLIWPVGFSAATLDPVNNPDYYNGGAKDGPTAHWTLLSDFGSTVDVLQGEWIGVMVASTGDGGGVDDATGFFYETGVGVVDPWVSLKFYVECGGTSGNGGWHIRDWMFNFQLAVELTSDRGPVFTSVDPLITTVSTAARAISADITDDNPIGGAAGVAAVTLTYQLDSLTATVNTIQMTMTAGTDVDGTWEAELPGQSPGTFVYWKITATDVGANSTVSSPFSYYIFESVAGHELVFNNQERLYGQGDTYILTRYLNGVGSFDIWDASYGGITDELTANYDIIVELAGYDGPIWGNDDEIEAWWDGSKTYIATGDEWLGARSGWVDQTYAAGDIQFDILGIAADHNDVNSDADGISRLHVVADDPAVGALYTFLQTGEMFIDSTNADTSLWDTTYAESYLNYDPAYETGLRNQLDGVDAVTGYTVAMTGIAGALDSADAADPDSTVFNVMIYGQQGNGGKSAFLAFDPIALNTAPTYYWIGAYPYNVGLSPLMLAIAWADGVVSTGSEISLPSEFTLKANYPNPFNPTTNIAFNLDVRSDVTVTVYSLLGEEVTTIRSRGMQPGLQSVKWNGTNSQGIQVASGVYIYRVEAHDRALTGKMMLLK